jgi:hypothetical protein
MSKFSPLNTTIGTTQFSSGPVTVVTFAAPVPSGPSDHHTRTSRSVRLHFHCTALATVLPLHYTGNCTSLALHWQLHFTCNCTSLATALHLHFTGNCASLATALHLQLRFTCTSLATALPLHFTVNCTLPALATALPLHYTGNCAFVATVLLSASAIPACATANVTVVAIHRNPLIPWGPCDFHGHPCASFAPAFTYETKIVMQNPPQMWTNFEHNLQSCCGLPKGFPVLSCTHSTDSSP